MSNRYTRELSKRGRAAFRLGTIVFVATTLGYYLLGCWVGMNARFGKSLLSLSDDRWELSECVYAAAITLTTVGYTDLLGTESLLVFEDAAGRHRWESATDPHRDPDFDDSSAQLFADYSPITRAATTVSVIIGITFFLYVIAQVTSFFVEGDYEELRIRRWTKRRISRLKDHVVICGVDDTSLFAIARLAHFEVPCVVIESDRERVQRFRVKSGSVPCLIGDATEEDSLRDAGIDRARALMSSLKEDGMNLVAVVTAHQIRPSLRLVSRATKASSCRRLQLAGATAVQPERLAGMRLASSLVRPGAVQFLDQVLGAGLRGALQLQEVTVGPCQMVPLGAFGVFERTGLVPLAARRKDQEGEIYNPSEALSLSEGDHLAVLGTRGQLEELEVVLREPSSTFDPSHRGHAHPPVISLPEGQEVSLDEIRDHYIVCGAGETGAWVIRELLDTHRPFVVIDEGVEALISLRDEIPEAMLIDGDAEDPDVLLRAGIERARGLAVHLGSDRANLVVVVTALQASPGLRVLALCEDRESDRFVKAGAEVIPKGKYGGGRMVAELLRPQVTGFLDRMLLSKDAVRIESLRVSADSRVAGKTLGEADLFGIAGVRAMALSRPGSKDFTANPKFDEVLEEGTRIVVVGSPGQLANLQLHVGGFG